MEDVGSQLERNEIERRVSLEAIASLFRTLERTQPQTAIEPTVEAGTLVNSWTPKRPHLPPAKAYTRTRTTSHSVNLRQTFVHVTHVQSCAVPDVATASGGKATAACPRPMPTNIIYACLVQTSNLGAGLKCPLAKSLLRLCTDISARMPYRLQAAGLSGNERILQLRKSAAHVRTIRLDSCKCVGLSGPSSAYELESRG